MNKKIINYNDIQSFLPDNITMCNKHYWEKKIDGLPDGYPELLEALSRVEYSDKYIENLTEKIKIAAIEYNNKIESELLGRTNEPTNEQEINMLLQENKNIPLDYYNAK